MHRFLLQSPFISSIPRDVLISGFNWNITVAVQAVLLALCKDTHGMFAATLTATLALARLPVAGCMKAALSSVVKDVKALACWHPMGC